MKASNPQTSHPQPPSFFRQLNFKIWLGLYLVFSCAYIAIRSAHPFDLDWIIKCVPLFLLIALCHNALSGKTQKFMVSALGFSVLGDFLLSLNGYFLFGLGSFLIAQLTYAAFFIRQFTLSKHGLAWALLVVTYLTIAASFILPKAGDFSFAIIAYMTAISLMAMSAGFRSYTAGSVRMLSQYILIALGAFIFMISDTLIAVNKFVAPFNEAGALIMITYYLAQLMITLGVIRHQRQTIEPPTQG